MPFEIVRNDITRMQVDAIVNTANPKPVIGYGVDSAIHEKAGPRLLEAREKIGSIPVGSAAVTAGFGLPSKYVIHTVGPVWHGGLMGESRQLRSCYREALRLAVEHGCHSVAFPLISSGNYGFPRDKALSIAIAAFSEFLTEQEMELYLVVFDDQSYKLSEKLFRSVASYIDENYIEQHHPFRERRDRRASESVVLECAPAVGRIPTTRPCAVESISLEDMLKQEDAGFTETLLKLIDQAGKKDSEVYKKALLSKQHFSKIRNNPNYKPTKPTALALALALELDLAATKDLIGRAGYALTNSSKFDLIIRYFIEQGKYNLVEINLALYEFDQTLLGV